MISVGPEIQRISQFVRNGPGTVLQKLLTFRKLRRHVLATA
eukprot:CAMPEP_0198351168 /NCGR_PEP_ID=MMETSP1450-20131203/101798_1 /TAXON_ID=753684 ORGANISM="Madagascaria erythrocladiodes, Strain CCMP3234" /NCGR_SAMPLE_ID=MMETSP1450 /ASSEMBLY_ACC=CAM_ASM_001115 /LENGTH=40 /DNA_ID= /DNA_START= /DNA_END= /DNA_ORIENTATION=